MHPVRNLPPIRARGRPLSLNPGARVCDSQRLAWSKGARRDLERREVAALLRLLEPRSVKAERESVTRSGLHARSVWGRKRGVLRFRPCFASMTRSNSTSQSARPNYSQSDIRCAPVPSDRIRIKALPGQAVHALRFPTRQGLKARHVLAQAGLSSIALAPEEGGKEPRPTAAFRPRATHRAFPPDPPTQRVGRQ